MQGLFDSIAAVLFIVVVSQWYATTRFFGSFPRSLIGPTIRYVLKTPKAFFFLSSPLVPIVALGGHFFPDHFPPLPVALCVMLGVTAASSYALPPAVLVLSSSKIENTNLVFDAGLAVLPLRLVHLIQPPLKDIDFISGDVLDTDSLRTSSDSAWRSVVHPLMDSVPIVVVDTRTPSRAIVEETARMLDPARRRKAIFIVGDDGSRPALDAAIGMDVKPNIQTVPVGKVAAILRSRTRRLNLQSKEPFHDEEFGFMLTIPRHWSRTPLRAQFKRDGGRFAVRSKHGATLNVSCGDPDPNMPEDRQQRSNQILRFLCSSLSTEMTNPIACQPASDQLNIASGQVITPQGVHGLISIIRGGIEYALQYAIPISAPFSSVQEVNDLVLSFRFSDDLESPLFVDPEAG